MVELTHTLVDPMGFHARSVMLVCNEAQRWKSEVTVSHGELSSTADDAISLMGLNAHVGDTLTVRIEGEDEQDAADFFAHLLRRL